MTPRDDGMVLVRRDDLEQAMLWGTHADTDVNRRLHAAMRGEAATVDEKIKWGGEDGTEGRVTARRYCSPWLPVDRPEHSQLLARVESERDEARWDASVARTEQDAAIAAATQELQAENKRLNLDLISALGQEQDRYEQDVAYEQACEQLKRDNQELQAVTARYRAALERIAAHDSDDPFAEAAIARAALGTDAHDNPIYGSITDQTP